MRIFVTGGSGKMGRALREFLPDATYLSREECDVTNAEQVDAALRSRPDVVIHAAAITGHRYPDIGLLLKTNYHATGIIVDAAQRNGVKVAYLSTHYVYWGRLGNHRETDILRPIGNYAWTKMAGESLLRPGDLIIRGSWYDKEKLAKWDGAARDAYCSREPVRDAAKKIALLVTKGAEGIYNIGGKRRTFWEIARDEGMEMRTRHRRELTNAYDFPADSSVNTDKYAAFVAGRSA